MREFSSNIHISKFDLSDISYKHHAGRGTEKFAAEEIISKLAATDLQIVDGKVFFSCTADQFDRIYSLKSVERAFVQVLSCRKPINKVVKVTVQDVGRYIMNKELWTLPGLQTVIADICGVNSGDTGGGAGCSPAKKKRTSSDGVNFRVSCKCTGRVGRIIPGQRLSRYLGQGLRRLIGWSVELRNPDIEVCVHLNDEGLTVGIPLQRVPLSKRGYIKHYGLRSTIAWIMTHLLHIKPGDTVVDPLCGKATLLQEASVQHQCHAQYLGVDNDSGQLTHAVHNLEQTGIQNNIQLLRGDATRLPIQSCSVDGVVTDAPFGQKFVPDSDLKIFYENTLTEISRILKPRGRVVLLTSQILCTWLIKRFSRLTDQALVIPGNKADDGEVANGTGASAKTASYNAGTDKTVIEEMMTSQQESHVLPNLEDTVLKNKISLSLECHTEKISSEPEPNLVGLSDLKKSVQKDRPSVKFHCDFGESRHNAAFSVNNVVSEQPKVKSKQDPCESNNDEASDIKGSIDNGCKGVRNKTLPEGDCVVPVAIPVPTADNLVPTGDTSVPTGDTLAPTGDTLIPTGDTLVPTGDTLAPTGDTLIPTGDTLVPTGDTLAPTGDTLIPTGETLVPTGDTLVSTGESLVPTGDTLAPTGDIPVKSDQDHGTHQDLVLLESHYVKLGETDACICIFMKE